MDDDQRARARMVGLLVEDLALPERWWWLSFADGQLPVGTQFLGVVIVKARGMGWACRRAHELGINPGGEVQGTEFPDGAIAPPEYVGRLLTKEECAAADVEITLRNPPGDPT